MLTKLIKKNIMIGTKNCCKETRNAMTLSNQIWNYVINVISYFRRKQTKKLNLNNYKKQPLSYTKRMRSLKDKEVSYSYANNPKY